MPAEPVESPSVTPLLPRPPSDAKIIVIAFAVGLFICVVSAVANAFLFGTGDPLAKILQKCNAIGGVVAILLVWRLLRWSRERNQLIRERATVVAGLNHEIRNAIQTISYSIFQQQGNSLNAIQQSVARIEQALDEYVPVQRPRGMRVSGRRRGNRQPPRNYS